MRTMPTGQLFFDASGGGGGREVDELVEEMEGDRPVTSFALSASSSGLEVFASSAWQAAIVSNKVSIRHERRAGVMLPSPFPWVFIGNPKTRGSRALLPAAHALFR